MKKKKKKKKKTLSKGVLTEALKNHVHTPGEPEANKGGIIKLVDEYRNGDRPMPPGRSAVQRNPQQVLQDKAAAQVASNAYKEAHKMWPRSVVGWSKTIDGIPFEARERNTHKLSAYDGFMEALKEAMDKINEKKGGALKAIRGGQDPATAAQMMVQELDLPWAKFLVRGYGAVGTEEDKKKALTELWGKKGGVAAYRGTKKITVLKRVNKPLEPQAPR